MKEVRDRASGEIYESIHWDGKNIEEFKYAFGEKNIRLVDKKRLEKYIDRGDFFLLCERQMRELLLEGNDDNEVLFIKSTIVDGRYSFCYDNWVSIKLNCWVAGPKGKDTKYGVYSEQVFESWFEEPGSISDGYHTFDELYEYRKLYNALAFNFMATDKRYQVVKSKRHSDGKECFGGGWFIVMATLPGIGQVSNHYEMKDWDLFKCSEVYRPYEWDGHTTEEAARRLEEFLKSPDNDYKLRMDEIQFKDQSETPDIKEE